MNKKLYSFIFLVIVVTILIVIAEDSHIHEANTVEQDRPPVGLCVGYVRPDFELIDVVEVTMYHPVPGQTDDTPDIVADGTWFDIPTAGELKWIAVSRDLHKRWGGPLSFGDVVYLEIPGDEEKVKSGFYLVKDTMNARFTSRIDILESPNAPIYKFSSAILYLAYRDDIGSQQLWELNNLGLVAP